MRSIRAWAAASALIALAPWLAPRPAAAAWSIVAVDPSQRQVGMALASCEVGVEFLGGVVPGRGAFVAQGDHSSAALARALELLAEGRGPREVLEVVANEEFDPPRPWGGSWQSRQYGGAALDAVPATGAFTGTEVPGWSGVAAAQTFAVAGEALAGAQVLAAMVEGFRSEFPARSGACRIALADRLMRALEGGARAGGDPRCASAGGARTAWLAVADPGDDPSKPLIDLVVPQRFGRLGVLWNLISPYEPEPTARPAVAQLRLRYAEWLAGKAPVCPERRPVGR